MLSCSRPRGWQPTGRREGLRSLGEAIYVSSSVAEEGRREKLFVLLNSNERMWEAKVCVVFPETAKVALFLECQLAAQGAQGAAQP